MTLPTASTLISTRTTVRPAKVQIPYFSFAAYAKTLLTHLQSSLNIHILPGLMDAELAFLESNLSLDFPPDLRSLLQIGIPYSPDFPNWRSSLSQLRPLVHYPSLSLLCEISKDNFWCDVWGDKPDNLASATNMVSHILRKAPLLLPVYKHCYMPCNPNLAGNPVFYINGGEVMIVGHDIAGFFKGIGGEGFRPAWAANKARMIEVWSDVAETCKKRRKNNIRECLEGMEKKLREGG